MQSAERDEEEPGNQPSQATMQWGSPQPRSGEGAAERGGSGYLTSYSGVPSGAACSSGRHTVAMILSASVWRLAVHSGNR
jgi:hypothetical protein